MINHPNRSKKSDWAKLGLLTVEQLQARYASACDLKQTVDRVKITAALHEWCIQIGAPAETKISFIGRAARAASAARDASAAWDAWAARAAWDAWDAWDARAARAASAARAARAASAASAAWAAWAASAAWDAWDARDARAARAASAARDASAAWDARDAWDATYCPVLAIGAVSLNDEKQAQLWLPLLAAFEAGCFAFFITDAEIFVSTIPAKVQLDDQRRLHCENGPAFVWLEDVQDFYWHGTNVPAEWITAKTTLTAKAALTWQNVEQRRAACEIVGWENILRELKAKTIDRDEDEKIGELVEVNIPEIGKERFLRVLCGTGRRFALPVPPTMKTALEANAWTYGVDTQVLKALEART